MDYLARNTITIGDVRELAGRLEPQSVQTIVTSPPYWNLRSYLDKDHADKGRELGGEATPAEFVANLVAVFRALRPALKDDGCLWLNLGDSYSGGGGFSPDAPSNRNGSLSSKRGDGGTGTTAYKGRKAAEGYPQKCLLGIPWRVAFALIDDGWILRSDVIWAKPAPMPESVTDRPTRSHEYLFLLTKSPRYFYDQDAIREPLLPESIKRGEYGHSSFGKGQFAGSPTDGRHQGGKGVSKVADLQNPAGRNKRSVWTVHSAAFPDAHYATFPPDLVRPCVLAGTSAAGECANCGKAWARVVERTTVRELARRAGHEPPTPPSYVANGRHEAHTVSSAGVFVAGNQAKSPLVETTGWAPQCNCPPGTPTRPQTVLDPFMGSGTTASVAHELGRDWQGFDLDERAIGWTNARLAKLPVGTLPGLASAAD